MVIITITFMAFFNPCVHVSISTALSTYPYAGSQSLTYKLTGRKTNSHVLVERRTKGQWLLNFGVCKNYLGTLLKM